MLGRDRLMKMQIHQLVDACVFGFSFWIIYLIREDPTVQEWLHLDPVEGFERFRWLFVVLMPAAPMVLEAMGFYSRPILCSRRATAWLLLKACGLITVGVLLGLFSLKIYLARGVVLGFGVLSFALMFLKEEILLLDIKSRLGQKAFRRLFILVGTGDETARLRRDFEKKSPEAIHIVAEIDLQRVPVQRLVDLVHEHSVNGVVISVTRSSFDQVETAIHACELEGVEVWLVADFFKTQISRTSFDDYFGQTMLVFRTGPEASWQGVFKQLFDFVGACVLLILSSPILLVTAVLVKVTSPGPIFFRQQRSGLNGRPFTLYKFRTMVTNADQLKHELAAMNEMAGPVFKIANDPRITPLGRLLRKFSLDEFPQLVNVIRGEMSLVGPRPLPVDEVKRFHDLAHRRRLSVKPGLTCLWQVSGRNNVKDFKDWVRLDLEYIDNWSLWLDFKILCRTVPVVLTGSGAR